MKDCFKNLLLITGILASSATVAATVAAANENNVWSYEDNEGVAHFSNVPDGSRYRLYLKDPGSYHLKSDRPEDRSAGRAVSSRTVLMDQNKLPFADMVNAAAAEQKIDPALLHAIIHELKMTRTDFFKMWACYEKT